MRPVSILIVVVLPAPFGPRKPKISPRGTSKLTPCTASTRLPREEPAVNVFVEPSLRPVDQPSRAHGPGAAAADASSVVLRRESAPRRRTPPDARRWLVYSWSLYWILRGLMPRIVRRLRRRAAARLERLQDRVALEVGDASSRGSADGVARASARHRRRAGAAPRCAAPSQSTTARSIAFSSSRTLPGQRVAAERARARRRRSRRCACRSRRAKRRRKNAGERGDVARAVAERRDLERDDVEAVVEVLAEAALARCAGCRSRFVAAMMRTSTLSVSLPPTRSNVRSCRKRRSFTCVAAAGSRRSRRGRACRRRPARSGPRGARPRR